MLVQDPETGEWYDDENVEMYEPQTIPERPPFRDTEPTPLGMGLGGRYVAPRGVRSVSLPPDTRQPTLLNDVSYEEQPGVPPRGSVEPGMITGYGTRVMLRKPGESAWLTPGGVEAPPEYVRDVEETMSALDRGEMSETQLKEKIKRQERPPGPEPTPEKLDRVLFTKSHMEEQDSKLQERAEKATREWENSIPYSTRALKPEVFNMKRAEVRKAFYNEYRNEELQLVDKYITERQAADKLAATPPSDDKRIENALTTKLGRKPTDREFIDEKQRLQIQVAGAKAGASEQAKLDTQKGMVTDADVANYAKYVATSGEFPPEFNRLFRLPQVQLETMKRVTALLNEQGFDGADRAVQAAAYKAGKVSLNFQEKQLGSARSFALNIEGQTKRVEEIMSDVISRVGVRAIDLPVRELKTRFAGSGQERVLESYLMEISREIGKLSTGSQASIAELSVEAQKKWDKIHDPNLSLKELKEILNATREQAGIRIKSMDDALKIQMERLREAPMQRIGGEPSQADLEFTAKKHGITVDEVKRRIEVKRKR